MVIAEKINVLIVGGWVDHAFTFVRSFSKQEHINMFVADCWPNSSCGHSRHCKGFRIIPVYKDPKYVSAILDVCREDKIDVVLPVHHEDLVEVSKKKQLFEDAGIRVPIPSHSLIELAIDKYRMARIASENGISAPATYLASEIKPDDLEFPALVKLRNSTGQRGQKKVRNAKELESQVHSLLGKYGEEEIIVQEYIPGTVQDTMYTVGLLYNHHYELKACVPLKKIRSRPYTGGTAICTRAENRADVKEMAIKLADAVGKWEGIVDVEIKIDFRNGKPIYIELNPRPWGSIYGAYAAGVDFPLLWLKVALREDFDIIDEFKEGIYASFLSRDLVLLKELAEKLFTEEREEVWKVLRTYSQPYFHRSKNSEVSATSDFVLDDLVPFFKNLSRFKENLLPKVWTER